MERRTAMFDRFCLVNIIKLETILKQATPNIRMSTMNMIFLVNSNDLKKFGFSLVQSVTKKPPPDSIEICLV